MRRSFYLVIGIADFFVNIVNIRGNAIVISKGLKISGRPFFRVHRSSRCIFGKNLKINSNFPSNPVTNASKCIFFVGPKARLEIGNDVGISQASIIARKSVKIGNNVKIGSGACIFDTDFHSLDKHERRDSLTDKEKSKCASVQIGNDCFIGANSIILKGCNLADGTILAAGSVLSKSTSINQVWGGNPAKFLKNT